MLLSILELHEHRLTCYCPHSDNTNTDLHVTVHTQTTQALTYMLLPILRYTSTDLHATVQSQTTPAVTYMLLPIFGRHQH